MAIKEKKQTIRIMPVLYLLLFAGVVAPQYFIINSPWNRVVKFNANGNVYIDGQYYNKTYRTWAWDNDPYSIPRGALGFIKPGVPNEISWIVDGHLYPDDSLYEHTQPGSFPSSGALRLVNPSGAVAACFTPTGHLYISGQNSNTRACSTPTYEPLKWNDQSDIQGENNCYDYANDQITYERNATPGKAHNYDPYFDPDYPGGVYKETIIKGAMLDGMDTVGAALPPPDYVCQNGGHLVFFAIGLNDFHWLRLDKPQNTWSHKPGPGSEVTNHSYDTNTHTWSGPVITNPLTADLEIYKWLGIFLCTCGNDAFIKE
jgi:hypothetical protein